MHHTCQALPPGNALPGGYVDGFDRLGITSAAVELARYGMLETIRQFAEEQLAGGDSSDEVRDLHARYFVGKEDEVIADWNGPNLREATRWFERELANLRAAFRWSASRRDLDGAAAIAIFGSVIGYVSDRWEPVAWAEELLEPARAAGHGRLASLYLMASTCGWGGRVADGIAYAESALKLLDGADHQEGPIVGTYMWAASAYGVAGAFDKMIPLWEREVASGDPTGQAGVGLGQALFFSGHQEEGLARAVAAVAVAEAGANPNAIAYALYVYGTTHATVDASRAKAALEGAVSVPSGSTVQPP